EGTGQDAQHRLNLACCGRAAASIAHDRARVAQRRATRCSTRAVLASGWRLETVISDDNTHDVRAGRRWHAPWIELAARSEQGAGMRRLGLRSITARDTD